MSVEQDAIAYGERLWRRVGLQEQAEGRRCFGCDANHYTICENPDCAIPRDQRRAEHVIEVVAASDRVIQQCTCGWSGTMRYFTALSTLLGEAEVHLRSVQ